MSWVTVIWSMTASVSLTLAGLHALIWCRQREAWANLMFALTAVGTAAFAACEFWMMCSSTPGEMAAAMRWIHVPAWVLVVSMVCFVRLYLRAGRIWLAWLIGGVRTISLLLDFLTGVNLNFREITALHPVQFLGETVATPVGLVNPWMLTGQLSLWLLILFTLDAAITAWRRGDRRQAWAIGGGIIIFEVSGTVLSVLLVGQHGEMPFIVSLFYLGIVLAMGCELSRDALRVAQLDHAWQALDQRQHEMAIAQCCIGLLHQQTELRATTAHGQRA